MLRKPLTVAVLVALLLTVAQTLAAQDAPTPRQSYQRAEALFAQGHEFTAEEETALNDLRDRLVESGDSDLAASLDLLRLGAVTSARVEADRAAAAAATEADTQLWNEREQHLRDLGFWRGVRDTGLVVFTTATAASLFIAVINDRNEGYMRNGLYSDWVNKRAFVDAMNWALLGTVTTSFFSLFPLLWGEAHQ